jgi:D-alanine-D-alanine ligase
VHAPEPLNAPLVAVVHSLVPPGADREERDTLDAAADIAESLEEAGFRTARLAFTRETLKTELARLSPVGLFNLVESVDGRNDEIDLPVRLFEEWGYAYCGAGPRAMRETTDKLGTKRLLRDKNLPTAAWLEEDDIAAAKTLDRRYILKSVTEDASLGIGRDSVTDSADGLRRLLADRKARYGGIWFAEEFIEGREFNISIMDGPKGEGRVLPLAEIRFLDFPDDIPRIVSYDAKWNDETFECRNTVREFLEPGLEPELEAELARVTLACWEEFGLRGWARVDFRVDREGAAKVLEVNANPCISKGAGFLAACEKAGMRHRDVILALCKDFLP